MDQTQSGEVIILSQCDAERLAQGISDLMELVWQMLESRRIVMAAPTATKAARIKKSCRRPNTRHLPLEELF